MAKRRQSEQMQDNLKTQRDPVTTWMEQTVEQTSSGSATILQEARDRAKDNPMTSLPENSKDTRTKRRGQTTMVTTPMTIWRMKPQRLTK